MSCSFAGSVVATFGAAASSAMCGGRSHGASFLARTSGTIVLASTPAARRLERCQTWLSAAASVCMSSPFLGLGSHAQRWCCAANHRRALPQMCGRRSDD